MNKCKGCQYYERIATGVDLHEKLSLRVTSAMKLKIMRTNMSKKEYRCWNYISKKERKNIKTAKYLPNKR